MNFFKHIFWSLVWGVLVTLLLLLPSDGIPKLSFNFFVPIDKFVHFILFGFWTLFLIVGLKKQNKSILLSRKSKVIASVFIFCYSLLIEIIQDNFIETREGEVMDLAANFFGIVFGIFLFNLIYGEKMWKLT